MGRKSDDLGGRRFGMLTARKATGERRSGYTVWRCTCDCGEEVLVSSRCLKNGWASSCGCVRRDERGRSAVSGSGEGTAPGILVQESGDRMEVAGQRDPCQRNAGGIKAKHQRSREDTNPITAESREDVDQIRAEHQRNREDTNHTMTEDQGTRGAIGRRGHAPKDWVGKRFGSLTVSAYEGKQGGKHYWLCTCDCGRQTRVCQSNLQSGHTRSCGCMVNPVRTRHFVEGTCLESIKSRKLFASNTSGVRGVYRNKRTGRWSAQITFQGHTRYLGSFEELEDAVRARIEGERIFQEFLEIHDIQDREE